MKIALLVSDQCNLTPEQLQVDGRDVIVKYDFNDKVDYLITDDQKLLSQIIKGEIAANFKIIAIGSDLYLYENWGDYLAANGHAVIPRRKLNKADIDQINLVLSENISDHLVDLFPEKELKIQEHKITHWGRIGFGFDFITLGSYQAKVDSLAVRGFLDLLTAFLLEYHSYKDEILPMHIECAQAKDEFHLLLSFQSNPEEVDAIFEQFYITYGQEMWPKSLLLWVERLSIYHVQSVNRVYFLASWTQSFSKEDGQYPAFCFQTIDGLKAWQGSTQASYKEGESFEDLEKTLDSVSFIREKKSLAQNLFADEKGEIISQKPQEILQIFEKTKDVEDPEELVNMIKSQGVEEEQVQVIRSKVESLKKDERAYKALKSVCEDKEEVQKIQGQAEDEFKSTVIGGLAESLSQKMNSVEKIRGLKEKAEEVIRISGHGNAEEMQDFTSRFFESVKRNTKDKKPDKVVISKCLAEIMEEKPPAQLIRGSREQQKQFKQMIAQSLGIDEQEVDKIIVRGEKHSNEYEKELTAEKVIERSQKPDEDDLIEVKSLQEKLANGQQLDSAELSYVSKLNKETEKYKKELAKVKRKYGKFQKALNVENLNIKKELQTAEKIIKHKDVTIKGLENNIEQIRKKEEQDQRKEQILSEKLREAEAKKQESFKEIEMLKKEKRKGELDLEKTEEKLEDLNPEEFNKKANEEIAKARQKSLELQKQLQEEKINAQKEIAKAKKEALDLKSELRQKDALLQKMKNSQASSQSQSNSNNHQADVIPLKKFQQLDGNYKKIQKDYAVSLKENGEFKKEVLVLKKTKTTLENKLKTLEKELERLKKEEKRSA